MYQKTHYLIESTLFFYATGNIFNWIRPWPISRKRKYTHTRHTKRKKNWRSLVPSSLRPWPHPNRMRPTFDSSISYPSFFQLNLRLLSWDWIYIDLKGEELHFPAILADWVIPKLQSELSKFNIFHDTNYYFLIQDSTVNNVVAGVQQTLHVAWFVDSTTVTLKKTEEAHCFEEIKQKKLKICQSFRNRMETQLSFLYKKKEHIIVLTWGKITSLILKINRFDLLRYSTKRKCWSVWPSIKLLRPSQIWIVIWTTAQDLRKIKEVYACLPTENN